MRKIVTILLYFFFAINVFGDEGRFTIEPAKTSGETGSSGIEVKVKVIQSSSDSALSIGERVQLKVRDARDGDRCDTKGDGGSGPTDSEGYIYGTCYANSAGDISVYAFSLDRSDESSNTSLSFANGTTDSSAPSPTASFPKPSSTTQKLTQQRTQSNFGGNGLAPLTEKPDNGLAPIDDKVLGETTERTTTPQGDGDLLKTLIFLTGACILIIWTIYMVLVQRGLVKNKRKKQYAGGITPQPMD